MTDFFSQDAWPGRLPGRQVPLWRKGQRIENKPLFIKVIPEFPVTAQLGIETETGPRKNFSG